jgi:predicted ester cyclase
LSDIRDELGRWLHGLSRRTGGPLHDALGARLAPAALWRVAAPIGDLHGPTAIAEGWYAPLHAALAGAFRRDDLLLGGTSRTASGNWVAWLGQIMGNFEAPLFGIAPTGKLVALRCGEFYRIGADGRIAEAVILPDVIDLMRQVGLTPLPLDLGNDRIFPPPATHDGVCPPHPERSEASAALVEAMLFDLRSFEPGSFESAGQTGAGGYWHEDMLWYGPSGIGANFTYDGFQRDHRIPFLTAFPDRVGGNHFARFGDGDYVCSGGWPSMTMTHRGPYLGVAATDRPMTLRVMDFWRVQDGSIRENWVLLDLIDLFAQMGVRIGPGA